MRIFAPGFGAGAVGGYAVMRVDPAVIADTTASMPAAPAAAHDAGPESTPMENVQAAFG